MKKDDYKGPNFLVVGTQKGGTTSLYHILKQHPRIFLPGKKEIHFFDWDYDKGIEWYISHFEQATNEHHAIGEITPNYMYDPNVPERILKDLGGNIKLIFILRNPADRAFSSYQMNVGRHKETNTFIKACMKDINNNTESIEYHYIKRGYYDEQIKRYLNLFKKENMLFLLFEEDTINKRKETFDRIFDFLNIEKLNISLNIKIRPGIVKNKLADKIINTSNPINQFAKLIIPNKLFRMKIKYYFTRLNQKSRNDKSELDEIRPFLINEIYIERILELEKLIDRDLSSWYKL